MKRYFIPLFCLLFLGCNTADAPGKALSEVGRAIARNKLGDLKDHLAWQAKNDYGSRKGLDRLRQAAHGDAITLGTVNALGGPIYRKDQIWQYYNGSLYAGDRPYIEAEIICASELIDDAEYRSLNGVRTTFCFVSKMELK